ncbi:hypothetical protein B484DRAFT_404842 [Ochromonadaceae sp. CCMP2298]|nr:hypothetical protein B484DRAFT_404842 [Ochromonadaceae sp. CCMP2298]
MFAAALGVPMLRGPNKKLLKGLVDEEGNRRKSASQKAAYEAKRQTKNLKALVEKQRVIIANGAALTQAAVQVAILQERANPPNHNKPGAVFSAFKIFHMMMGQPLFAFNMSQVDNLRGIQRLPRGCIGMIPSRTTVQLLRDTLAVAAAATFHEVKIDAFKCQVPPQRVLEELLTRLGWDTKYGFSMAEVEAGTLDWRAVRPFLVDYTQDGCSLTESGLGCVIGALKPVAPEAVRALSGRAGSLRPGGEQSTGACLVIEWTAGDDKAQNCME